MTNVYGTIQIVAAALHVKNGTPENAFYLGQLCQLFIWRTQINCIQVSGSLRRMDVSTSPMSLSALLDFLAVFKSSGKPFEVSLIVPFASVPCSRRA